MVIYSLISAATYLLVGISFSIIYRSVRFFHFAHALIFTSGPYFILFFKNWIGISFFYSLLLSLLFSSILGSLIEIMIYRPLRKKNASSLILLLASLGIYIVLQNIISLIFGDDTKSIRTSTVKEGINIYGSLITPLQISMIFISIIIFIMIVIWLQRTMLGKSIRAIASDSELARISGVNADKIILFTFCIGSVLAAIGGILFALDVDMNPTMGFNALLMGVIAVIIGGVNSTSGVILGALLLGFAQNFGVWKISSQWQDAIAFIILIIFLLFRPQGFLGKKVKRATV